MKNIIFTACCILLFVNIAYAKIVIDKLEEPSYRNTDGSTYKSEDNEKPVSSGTTRKITTRTAAPYLNENKINNFERSALNRIEKKLWGRDYRGDYDINRVARLERQVFGAVQGGSLNQRISRLQTASAGFNNSRRNYYDPYNPNTYSRKTGIISRALNNLGFGALTGYSPNINSFDPKYGPYYGNGFNGNSALNRYSNTYSNPYNAYYNGTRNYQNPYSGSTSFYDPSSTKQGPAYVKSNTGYRDIFSDGGNGSEMYYDDGRFRKDIRSTDGGCSVTIID